MGLGPPCCPKCHVMCMFSSELLKGYIIDKHNKNKKEYSHYVCEDCGIVGGYDHLEHYTSARTATSNPIFQEVQREMLNALLELQKGPKKNGPECNKSEQSVINTQSYKQ
jgi:hypothetical protein